MQAQGRVSTQSAASTSEAPRLTPRQRRLQAQKQAWKQQQQKQQQAQPQREKKGQQAPTKHAVLHPPQAEAPLPKQAHALAPQVAPLAQQGELGAPNLWSVWEEPPHPEVELQGPVIAQLAAHWASEAHVWRRQHPPQPHQPHQQQLTLSCSLTWEGLPQHSRSNAIANVAWLLTHARSQARSWPGGFHPLAPSSFMHEVAWVGAHFNELLPLEAQQELHALERDMGLPFKVVPMFATQLQLQDFVDEVKLSRSQIWLDGSTRAVPESRLTGWQSDIGATFMYSGTERFPEGPTLTPRVAAVRDALREATGEHYDSVLINYYEDERTGMRFHSDPLYGAWTPNTAVVSIGAERRFAFRSVANFEERTQFPVRNGDVVMMFGDCQDRFQHSVIVEKSGSRGLAGGPRISLVFKQRAL